MGAAQDGVAGEAASFETCAAVMSNAGAAICCGSFGEGTRDAAALHTAAEPAVFDTSAATWSCEGAVAGCSASDVVGDSAAAFQTPAGASPATSEGANVRSSPCQDCARARVGLDTAVDTPVFEVYSAACCTCDADEGGAAAFQSFAATAVTMATTAAAADAVASAAAAAAAAAALKEHSAGASISEFVDGVRDSAGFAIAVAGAVSDLTAVARSSEGAVAACSISIEGEAAAASLGASRVPA